MVARKWIPAARAPAQAAPASARRRSRPPNAHGSHLRYDPRPRSATAPAGRSQIPEDAFPVVTHRHLGIVVSRLARSRCRIRTGLPLRIADVVLGVRACDAGRFCMSAVVTPATYRSRRLVLHDLRCCHSSLRMPRRRREGGAGRGRRAAGERARAGRGRVARPVIAVRAAGAARAPRRRRRARWWSRRRPRLRARCWCSLTRLRSRRRSPAGTGRYGRAAGCLITCGWASWTAPGRGVSRTWWRGHRRLADARAAAAAARVAGADDPDDRGDDADARRVLHRDG